MKDISTPVPPEEFRKEIRNCLHQAALVNYTRVSAYARIEGTHSSIRCGLSLLYHLEMAQGFTHFIMSFCGLFNNYSTSARWI